jgi:hypothetical protein
VLNQEQQFRGVWAALATIFQSHPLTIRRIKKLVELELLSPERRPVVAASGPVIQQTSQIVSGARPALAD